MNRERIKKTIIAFLGAIAILNFSAVNANAEWIQDTSKQWSWIENNKKAVGWKLINSKWYFFNNNGNMATGWVKDGQTWYYLTNSGAMATGWIKDGQAWYYLNKSGAMKTGWLNDSGTWYYLNKSGTMKTGWLNDSGTWYYLNKSGAMKTGWLYDNGSWYYLNNSGSMATGWLTDDDNKYFLKSSGEMVTGNYIIDGVTYNFNGSGALIASETNENKPSNDKVEEKKAYVVTKSDPLNLREKPSADSAVLGRIPKGTEIIVTSKETNGFYKVLWNKLEGYVSSQWISFDKPVIEDDKKDEDVKDEDNDVKDDILDFAVRNTAPSTDNKYYYSNDNIFYSAKLSPPFYNNGQPIVGNCTWYAWGRIWEITNKKPTQAGFNGNAYEWWNANLKSGKYQYGTTPKVGALAVWKSSLANSGGCGHVAIVEKIENGKVYISESAWHGALFKYKEIYNVNDLYGYIYIDKPNY